MTRGWGREERPEIATEKILDAADKAFIEIGVSAAGMSQIADLAGCSRGTLYRYFANRHELHLAYIDHAARRIVERVRDGLARIDDPHERLVESILRSVHEVRANPGTAAWFEPASAGLAARRSRASEVIETLSTAFVERLLDADARDPQNRLRARWLVRVIVSLLAMPGQSEAEERAMVEQFVVPSLFV